MPLLHIAGTTAQVDLVVFDKDGTLIDFHRVWGPRMMRAAVALAAATGGGSELIGHLCRAVGYDHEQALVLDQGPLATAPHDQLESVVVTALFQSGQPWDRARALAREYLTPLMTAELSAAEIAPRVDLHQILAALTHNGTRLAIATTDCRRATEKLLDQLEIAGYFNTVLCGDDPGPVKPDPAVLTTLARHQDVNLRQVIMVGDSISDLAMAHSAGVTSIGVRGGVGSECELSAHADILIDDIGAIRPAG